MSVNQARLNKPIIILAALLFLCNCDVTDFKREQGASEEQALKTSGLVYAQASGRETSPIMAKIGDTSITQRAVVEEAMRRDPTLDASQIKPNDPLFREILHELIDQRMLALEASRRGLQTLDHAKMRLAAAEERILGNVLVEEIVSDTVTEDSIERIYREQQQLFPAIEEIRARHILVESRQEADEVARLLANGESFDQLANRVSQDPATRFNGGDLGYFTYDSIVPEFARMAYATLEGRVSAPFQTEYGWHVLKVVDRRQQPRQSLEDMRPSIVRFLTMQGLDTLLVDLREAYKVEIIEPSHDYETAIEKEQSPVPHAPDLH